MGVGRFVSTPILPLMHDQAGLSAGAGANLATVNYAGRLPWIRRYWTGRLLEGPGPCCSRRHNSGSPSASRRSMRATNSDADDLMVSRPGRPQGRGSTSTTHTVPSTVPVLSISGAPR
ncbi:Uncharacterised MFS-type transporter YbfB [Streptomyces sp. Ag109_O5-10]|nr:Uncharacterised MFS-type transporter YbfB [Streptomyces sp. Ag109_O5-10]